MSLSRGDQQALQKTNNNKYDGQQPKRESHEIEPPVKPKSQENRFP
jgi:hypothetical protein